MRNLGMALFALVATSAGMGCHEAHKIEDRTRCREVCSQVNECNTSIDISTCTDQCSVESDVDGGFEDKLSDCSSCVKVLDNCTENLDNCAARCAGVVDFPSSAN